MKAFLMALLLFACGTLQGKINWLPVEELAQPGVLVHDMALDSSGTWNAVWSRKTQSGYAIEISQKPAEQAWSEPTAIFSHAHAILVFSVVMDARDHLHVFWEEICTENPSKKIFYLREMERDSDGKWNAPSTLSKHSTFYSSPQTVKDPFGGVYVVWVKEQDEKWLARETLGVAEKHPGREWKTNDIVAKADRLGQPHMAVNAKGVVYLQWVENPRYSNASIQGAHTVEKEVWSGPYSVLTCPGLIWGKHEIPAEYPQIAFKPNGEPFTIFSEIPDPYRTRISYSEKIDEESWSEPTIISSNRMRSQVSTLPRVATNALGQIFTVWFSYKKGEGYTFQGAVYSPDSGWSKPVNISKSTSKINLFWGQEILLDDTGYPIVVLPELNQDNVVIHFSIYHPQKGWSDQGSVSLDLSARDLFFDLDPTGALITSWIEGNGDQRTIRSMRGILERD